MVDVVRGPAGAKPLDKTKNVRKTSSGGVSFADLLAEAEQAGGVENSPGAFGGAYASGLPLVEEEEKRKTLAQQQAEGLLATLQEAAEDILAGSPTLAAQKLKQYLASDVVDAANLTPDQQKALDDLQTRAAVTVAKMDSK